jgi:hypothetical protein
MSEESIHRGSGPGVPRCRKCGGRALLTTSEPHPNPGFHADRLTFECSACGASFVEIMERRR